MGVGGTAAPSRLGQTSRTPSSWAGGVWGQGPAGEGEENPAQLVSEGQQMIYMLSMRSCMTWFLPCASPYPSDSRSALTRFATLQLAACSSRIQKAELMLGM